MEYIFNRPQKTISIVTEISYSFSLELLVRSLVVTLGIFSGLTIPASAQITHEGDATPINPVNNTVDILVNKGQRQDGNLFHSFDKFNVNAGQTANFISTPGIQNILGRVNGTNGGSLIDGKLQVNGGSTTTAVNLFLMNPAGIVFGKGASLDINGAFTATTAKAIDLGNGNWFNAVGANTYGNLNGNPIGLAFTGSSTPGSIFSAATFDASPLDPINNPARTIQTAKPGQSITLVGGTVISTGDIKTAGGNISIATVEGGKYVQIKVEGSILGLSLPTSLPTSANSINSVAKNFTPLRLAELLTNTGVDLVANGVKNENGVLKLVVNDGNGSKDRSIASGDIVTKNLDTSAVPDGGKLSLKTQTGNIITSSLNTSGLLNPDNGSSKGGEVSLETQTGDIFVGSIDTSSQNFGGTGGTGGDLNVKAGGLFRVTGFDMQNRSIFTGGNRNGGSSLPETLQGGKINITHQGTSFVVGGQTDITPGQGGGNTVILIEPFSFPEDASGTRGAILSRNTNGTQQVVFKDGAFIGNFGDISGFEITAVPKSGKGAQPSNPDSQASRPKSKENCTPSSTSVASNPTAAPTRSAGNANTISADPCQPNTSNNGILQILTDRE